MLQQISQIPNLSRDVEKISLNSSNILVVSGMCLVRMSLILARNVASEVLNGSSQSENLGTELCFLVFQLLRNVRWQSGSDERKTYSQRLINPTVTLSGSEVE